ncbi:MAG: hypothetical protein SGJ19_21860, partial [Planctomycetia bacterium]|nr:hypothetical protein [Planctomycetia bacterium]
MLLALALSVVLLSLLTFSINVYMRASEAGRGEVERAQLARVLLRRMADDLRSTLWKNTEGTAATESESADSASGDSATASGSSGTGTGSGSQSGSGTGSGSSTGTGGGTGTNASDSSGDDASTSSPSTSTEVPPVMGLYGEQGYVQVDVSRLPRIEQYASAMAGTGDIVSDVKTVAYYCQNANSAAASSATGLSRREFDRAVTTYASTNGDISAWERELAPIAAEVTAIEFRYFDAAEMEWVTAWDSELKEALPVAVEIAIAISDGTATANTSGAGAASTSTLDASAEGQTIYRLMVFLPQSQTPQTSGASALETMVSSSISSAAASAAGGQTGASGAGG